VPAEIVGDTSSSTGPMMGASTTPCRSRHGPRRASLGEGLHRMAWEMGGAPPAETLEHPERR